MDNKEQLKKLARVFNSDKIVTTEDLSEVLSGIVGVIKSFKTQNEKLNADTELVVEKLLSQVESEHAEMVSKLNSIVDNSADKVEKSLDGALSRVTKLIEECRSAMPKDGAPGKDADEEYIISEVLSRIELPEYKETILDDGEDIVAKINGLRTDNEAYQIDASHIKNLPSFRGSVGSQARNLAQLLDVTISDVQDGDALKYDSATGKWINGVSGGAGWGLTGNAGTDDTVNFIGTTDAQDLVFKVNDTLQWGIEYAAGLPNITSRSGGLFLQNLGGGNIILYSDAGSISASVQPAGKFALAGGSGAGNQASLELFAADFGTMSLQAPDTMGSASGYIYQWPSGIPSEGAYMSAGAPVGTTIPMSWAGGPLIGSKNFWPSSSNATYDESYDTKTSGASTATGALNQVKWGLSVGTATDAHWGISGPSAGTYLGTFSTFFQQEFSGYAEFKPNTSSEKDLQLFWGTTARSVTTWLSGARRTFGSGSTLADSAIFYVEWDTDGYYLKAVTLDGDGNTTMTTIEKLNNPTNLARYWLRISANTNSVGFYVNKALVATHTTNIPNNFSGFEAWSYLSYGVTAGGENSSGAVVAAGPITHQVFGR